MEKQQRNRIMGQSRASISSKLSVYKDLQIMFIALTLNEYETIMIQSFLGKIKWC